MIFEKTVRCVFALVVSICLLSAVSARGFDRRDHAPDACQLEQAPELPAVQTASRRSTTPFDVRMATFTQPVADAPAAPRCAAIDRADTRASSAVIAYTPSISSRGPPRG